MELEELKNTWAVLDERLKKNEMLNKRMVQEMLCNKSNRALNKLMNTEFFSMLTLLVIPLCIWLYHQPRFENILSAKILYIVVIVTCILSAIWNCYKILKYLRNINFSKSIGDNLYYINKYNITIKKEKIVNYFVIFPVFSLLGILGYYELKATFSLWIFLFIVLTIGIATSYWMYKKIYDANIQSIKKSLEELKELKEE